MRRTTIFRSKLLPALAALTIAHGVARAQDTTLAVSRDTTPLVQGRTHFVQTGETLWSLAAQYLGDPLLWPAIYRINTLVIEDPHWIFPGEELQLVGPDSMLVAPGEQVVTSVGQDTLQRGLTPADTFVSAGIMPGDSTPGVDRPVAPPLSAGDLPPPPPPPGEGTPTIFAPRARAAASFGTSGRNRGLRPLSATDFFAAGFLTENDKLPWADVVAAVGKPKAGSLNEMASARIFESVELRAPEGATYQIGDSLLVARLAREIPPWGIVVVPAGLARVRETSGRRVVADVFTQYARVTTGQVAMPIEPFRNPGTVFPTPIDNGMTGTIIDVRDIHAVPGELNIVFLDRGREDGLTPGDIFEVLRPNPPEASPETPMQQVSILQVVHVRQRSASAQIIQITTTGIKPGVPVRLIRKMPS